MTETEHHVVKTVAGGGALAAVIWFIPRMVRALWAWFRSPSKASVTRERTATALESLTAANQKICQAIDGINVTLKQIDGNQISIINQQAVQAAAQRIIFEESNTPRWMCDENMRCVQTNAALERMFGMTSEEMRGYGWMDAIAPEFRASVLAEFKRAYSDPYGVAYEHNYPIRKEGHFQNVTAKAVETVMSADGSKVIAIFGICTPTKVLLEAV